LKIGNLIIKTKEISGKTKNYRFENR
jgi:hypothetical protein